MSREYTIYMMAGKQEPWVTSQVSFEAAQATSPDHIERCIWALDRVDEAMLVVFPFSTASHEDQTCSAVYALGWTDLLSQPDRSQIFVCRDGEIYGADRLRMVEFWNRRVDVPDGIPRPWIRRVGRMLNNDDLFFPHPLAEPKWLPGHIGFGRYSIGPAENPDRFRAIWVGDDMPAPSDEVDHRVSVQVDDATLIAQVFVSGNTEHWWFGAIEPILAIVDAVERAVQGAVVSVGLDRVELPAGSLSELNKA